MREALAGTNHDYLLRDDRRSEKPRRNGRDKAKKSAFVRLFGGRRRGLAFVTLVGLAAIGVPLNALYMQEGRHPAPLFQTSLTAPSPEPKAAPAPTPPARPQAQAPAQMLAAPAARPAAPKPEPAHAAEKTRDAIGDLLTGGAPKNEQSDRTILAAQRALAKLGYAVRADGVFGAATRQALEKFERDSGLPVKGELSPKVLRQLHARSGSSAQ